MKTAIASPIHCLSSSWKSHQCGLARIISSELTDGGEQHDVIWHTDEERFPDWNAFDRIYLWQGTALNGKLTMNLFGNQFPRYARRLHQLAKFRGELVPLLYPCYPYHELAGRNWATTKDEPGWVSGMTPKVWQAIEARCASAAPYLVDVWQSDHVVVGDSHAPSVWVKGANLRVHAGLTLHHILTDGLAAWVPEGYSRATIYFGQIDLRHHLCRQPNPEQAALKLAKDLGAAAHALALERGMTIELCELHPIETEDRSIPTPGWYKGTPFFGTWAQRQELRLIFNRELFMWTSVCSTLELYEFPRTWFGPAGEMDQQYMEHGGSVHVAPLHYRAFRTYELEF